jgi:hypothetical protein
MPDLVRGGLQPIVGAPVYLFAANKTGYGGFERRTSTGNPSDSPLNAASTAFSGSIGAYVLSGSGGALTISCDYSCTPNRQVCLYAVENPEVSVANYASMKDHECNE